MEDEVDPSICMLGWYVEHRPVQASAGDQKGKMAENMRAWMPWTSG